MSNLGNQELGDIILGASGEGEESFIGAHGQAQALIKTTYFGLGQAQADIKQTYVVHGQAQAHLANVYRAHGQSQAQIKATYSVHGQSQADIKQTYFAHGQCQARIKNTYFVHGQCQATILADDAPYLLDTFTRTTTFGTGIGSPDVGPAWVGNIAADREELKVNGSKLEIHIGDNAFNYGWQDSLISKNNVDYFGEFRIESNTGSPYYLFIFRVAGSEVYMSDFNEWSLVTATGETSATFATDINITYAFRLQVENGNARVKLWVAQEPEPTTWLITRTGANTTPDAVGFYIDEGFNSPAKILIDNLYVNDYYTETRQRQLGQSQAFIIASIKHGQAAGAINSVIKQSKGQAQATITPQNAILKDTFSRVIYLTDGPKSQIGAPDFGWYNDFGTVSRGMIGDGSKLVTLPYPGVTTKEAVFYTVVNLTNWTAFFDFTSSDYNITTGLIYIWGSDIPVAGWFDFYLDGDIFIIDTATGSTFTNFTLVDGQSYRMMLTSDGTNLKGKIWNLANAEPDWMLSISTTAFSVNRFGFEIYSGTVAAGTELSVDNISIYSTSSAIQQVYGQARAFIRNTKAHGQAIARIKATTNRHGQAQAFMRFYAGRGQAQALITRAVFKSGQAQATIDVPGLKSGQAQARITTTTPNGQAQGYIKVTWFPTGQTQGYIKLNRRVVGQAQAMIEIQTMAFAQAGTMIESATKVKSGQAQAVVYYTYFASGQAQAKINNILLVGQAQTRIKQVYRSHGQARAYIRYPMGHGQAQAYIFRTMGWGQAQSVIIGKLFSGQAQAFIEYRQVGIGLAQALMQKPQPAGQAQARILAFGQRRYGQARAFIRRTDTRFVHGQTRTQIKRNDPVGQAQALIEGGRYLVKYNGYHLPGYAQVEDYASTEGIYTAEVTYQDGPFSEYVGLENKAISLRMKVISETYLDVKNQVQQAGTIVRSSKDWEKLYIQRYDRHYLALTGRITTEKTVGQSMRVLDYTVEWEALPWLISDAVHTISGVGTIDTGARNLDNGGWTPAKVIISGTDVTVSGYNQYGEFTGFVSISGTVTNMVINTEQYTSTINGINSNNLMYNPDYMIFVGPGKTYFVVTGATSCVIEYQDRWYL